MPFVTTPWKWKTGWVTTAKRGGFTPLQLTALKGWWRADFGITIATGVSSWLDMSGNSNTLVQATGAKQPLFVASAINGRPGVQFDGVDDIMAKAFTLPQPLTVFAMMRQDSWTSGEIMLDGASSSTAALQQITASPQFRAIATTAVGPNSNLAVGSFGLVTAVFNGASSSLQVNNTTTQAGSTAGTPGGVTLGARGNDTVWAACTFADVIVMAAAATAGEIAGIKGYMTALYGVP